MYPGKARYVGLDKRRTSRGVGTPDTCPIECAGNPETPVFAPQCKDYAVKITQKNPQSCDHLITGNGEPVLLRNLMVDSDAPPPLRKIHSVT